MRSPAALFAFCAFALLPIARAADAPTDPGPTPYEISEAARKAYAQGMQEARDLLVRKDYDAAIARLDQLAVERPREPQARFLKAVVLTDQKKTDAAVETYRSLVADFPEMPEPHNNLAVIYAQRGQLALARDELMLAIQSAPEYAVARENLGDVYLQLAAEQYERAVAIDKRNKSVSAKLKLTREAAASAP